MRPMTYTVDVQKMRSAFVPCMQGAMLGAVLAMVGVMFDNLPPEDNFGVGFFLAGLVLVTVSIIAAIVLSCRLPATKNQLSIHRHGLAITRRGRPHRWPWRDLSAFALSRKSGKEVIVTFALPDKPGWTVNQWGPKAMIEDIYDAPLEEIAARLNEYRARAVGS